MSGFFPPVSVKVRTVVEFHEVRLCSTSHILWYALTRLFYYENGYSRTRSGEMARIACTHVAMGWIGRVLYSRVAWTRSRFRGSEGRLVYVG